jgi:hypothetical protein
MKRLVIAGAALAMAGTAQADDWATVESFGKTGSGFDLSTVDRMGDVATYWQIVVPSGMVLDKWRVDYILLKTEINCARKTTFTSAALVYGDDGYRIVERHYDGNPDDIAPESNGEHYRRLICDGDRSGVISMGKTAHETANLLRAMAINN